MTQPRPRRDVKRTRRRARDCVPRPDAAGSWRFTRLGGRLGNFFTRLRETGQRHAAPCTIFHRQFLENHPVPRLHPSAQGVPAAPSRALGAPCPAVSCLRPADFPARSRSSLLLGLAFAATPAHALRVTTYNLTLYNTGNSSFLARQANFRTIFAALQTDIIVGQEMGEQRHDGARRGRHVPRGAQVGPAQTLGALLHLQHGKRDLLGFLQGRCADHQRLWHNRPAGRVAGSM